MLERLVAMAWVWSCIGVPVLRAATPQQTTSTDSVRSASVTAITTDITVDGLLGEPEWRMAPTIGDLIQREPRTGDAPSEKTDVTLLHDGNYLFIGVMSYDSEPRRIIGTDMTRDANLRFEDRIEILLDTYGDQRNAFYFATNPAGALVDGLVFANGQSNLAWDAIWTVRTRRTNQGWSAEFAIPFKSLSFPSGRTVWGFNVSRTIQRKIEEDRWSGARLQTQFFQVSESGEITNLEGVTQGVGLDARPFLGGHWLHIGATGKSTVTGKPGLDMFYNVNPSLKLTTTVNTDFGETEVDARQINLSRFSLLFPEKRSFFLEDAGVFTFSNTSVRGMPYLGPARSEVIPFFSRQIGLLSGEEVPINIGVKLAGKVGRTDLGVLDVRTRDSSIGPGRNAFVGRVKRNLLQQSYVGAVFTNGNPSRAISSNTFGADVRLATSNFLGRSRNLIFNAYGLKSLNEGNSQRDSSYGASVEYPNDLVELELVWRDVQKDFEPALGFVSRRNVRLLRVGGRYAPRPKDFLGIQQMFQGAFYNRFTRLDSGETESWNLFLVSPIDFHFKSGDNLHALFSPDITYERLFAPFEISRAVFLPPGEYRYTRWTTNVATAGKRRLQASVKWLTGTYWSGHAEELQTTFSYKIPPRFVVSLSTDQTFARLPQGNFVARIVSSQVNYAASPFLTLSNLIQYDNLSRNLGWQSRVRWIVRPGEDVFFVFNQGWIQDRTDGNRFRFGAQDSKVSAKFQYTFRL